jgi:hypothetical protein
MDQQLDVFTNKIDANLKWAIIGLESVKTHVNEEKMFIIE